MWVATTSQAISLTTTFLGLFGLHVDVIPRGMAFEAKVRPTPVSLTSLGERLD